MNSVLLIQEDSTSEIKEMIKNMENIKAGIDIFEEMVKQQISPKTV